MTSSPIVEDLDALKLALFGFGFRVVILVIEQRCQHDGLVGRVIPARSRNDWHYFDFGWVSLSRNHLQLPGDGHASVRLHR